MQGQVKISPEFFRNERNNYGSWGVAFWRELFQNSVDANCSEIYVYIRHEKQDLPNGSPQNGVFISLSDNGCGMGHTTITDVYFCLGETTKHNDTIGGFGKARMLTCFSQHAYGIRTKDCLVSGTGSSFELTRTENERKGCEVWVDVDTKNKYGTINIKENLIDFLHWSQLPCSVRSNDPDVDCFSEWMYKRRFAKRLSFGTVYANKSGDMKGMLVVRVSGVPMFYRSLKRDDVQVVVELDPHISRQVLVSNRDSLHTDYENELDEFIQLIAVDTRNALKTFEPITEIVGNTDSSCLTTIEKIESVAAKCNIYSRVNIIPKGEEVAEKVESPIFILPANRFDDLIPSIVLHCDSADQRLRKSMWLFNPTSGDGSYFGGTKRKLTKIWAVALEFAIRRLLEITKKDSVQWRPGFVFSFDCDAKNIKHPDGVFSLLFNPVSESGKIKYKTRSRNDRVKMLVRAAHEVAHIRFSWHDEEFANLKDELFEYLMINEKLIFRTMDSVLKQKNAVPVVNL